MWGPFLILLYFFSVRNKGFILCTCRVQRPQKWCTQPCVHVLLTIQTCLKVERCTGFKCVHPAAKMCTPGAGCTLNFEHCFLIFRKERRPAGTNVGSFLNILIQKYILSFPKYMKYQWARAYLHPWSLRAHKKWSEV